MKKILTLIWLYSFIFMPVIVFAQKGNYDKYKFESKNVSNNNLGEITTIFDKIIGFINNSLIPLVFAIALLAFLWGIFKYFILGGGDESKRAEGKQLMLWSIIGFVVMVSIFGIVNIVASSLDLDKKGQDARLTIPAVPVR